MLNPFRGDGTEHLVIPPELATIAALRSEIERLRPAIDLLRRLVKDGCCEQCTDGIGDDYERCFYCFTSSRDFGVEWDRRHTRDCPYVAAKAFLASIDQSA